MQVIEHALAMRNLPGAETPRVGPVQARRMRFESQAVIPAPPERAGQREANDHGDHGTWPA